MPVSARGAANLKHFWPHREVLRDKEPAFNTAAPDIMANKAEWTGMELEWNVTRCVQAAKNEGSPVILSLR